MYFSKMRHLINGRFEKYVKYVEENVEKMKSEKS